MPESNIAVLVIGAALACGAIWLGDPPQPTTPSATPQATQPFAQTQPIVEAGAPRRLAAATTDCVAHPGSPDCGAQIVASVASDSQDLPHVQGTSHAPPPGCGGVASDLLHGDCSVSGDAVAL